MIGDLMIAASAEPGRSRASGAAVPSPARAADTAGPGTAPAGDPEQLEASRLKALLTDPNMRVSTHRDDSSGHVVMIVQDRGTGEVVEQFPSDKLLRLYAAMREKLVDEQA